MEDVACNLCGARDETVCFEKDGFRIVRCERCGLIYTNPRPEPEALWRTYGQGYSCYSRDPEQGVHGFRRRLRWIRRFVKSGNLLDVGCGTGEFLAAAQQDGWRCTGLDVSEYAVSAAKERFGVQASAGCVHDLDLSPESLDVITMWATVEHLHDPLGDLRILTRFLRPGGLLVIETGNIDSLQARQDGISWKLLSPPKHLYYFSKATLRRLLEEAGLRVARLETRGNTGRFASGLPRKICNLLRLGDHMYVYGLKDH